MGKKKEKVKYVDDGRTIADMSGVSRTSVFLPQKLSDNAAGRSDEKQARRNVRRQERSAYRASLKEQFSTFWNAVKMMFLPMLAVIGIICIAFLILYLLSLAA